MVQDFRNIGDKMTGEKKARLERQLRRICQDLAQAQIDMLIDVPPVYGPYDMAERIGETAKRAYYKIEDAETAIVNALQFLEKVDAQEGTIMRNSEATK
jgi:hypothetical protein